MNNSLNNTLKNLLYSSEIGYICTISPPDILPYHSNNTSAFWLDFCFPFYWKFY